MSTANTELNTIFREMQRDHHQHRAHRHHVQAQAHTHMRAAVDEVRIRSNQMQEGMSLAWRTSFSAWRMAAMAPAPLPGAPLGAPLAPNPFAPLPPPNPFALLPPPNPLAAQMAAANQLIAAAAGPLPQAPAVAALPPSYPPLRRVASPPVVLSSPEAGWFPPL